MKKCSKCEEFKDRSQFHRQNKKEDKLVSACKDCCSKRNKENRMKNIDKTREKDRERYQKTKDKRVDYAREYRKNNKDKTRDINLKSKYGITQEDYDNMKQKQNNCCVICGEHEDNLKRVLCVDHCHNTGVVRGLLCDTCNKFLGFYEKLHDKCEQYLEGDCNESV